MSLEPIPDFALVDLVTDRVVYADSLSDLVAEVLPGYMTITGIHADDERLVLRADALAVIANRSQAAIVASIGGEQLSEDALTVLMHDRRSQVLQLSEWDSDIPLLLMATSYAPYTSMPAPEGDAVILLDPHTERTFLDALATIGAIELFVHDGSD